MGQPIKGSRPAKSMDLTVRSGSMLKKGEIYPCGWLEVGAGKEQDNATKDLPVETSVHWGCSGHALDVQEGRGYV
ncbi:hypothetical protein Tco_1437608 [Tanacetum coccineum]